MAGLDKATSNLQPITPANPALAPDGTTESSWSKVDKGKARASNAEDGLTSATSHTTRTSLIGRRAQTGSSESIAADRRLAEGEKGDDVKCDAKPKQSRRGLAFRAEDGSSGENHRKAQFGKRGAIQRGEPQSLPANKDYRLELLIAQVEKLLDEELGDISGKEESILRSNTSATRYLAKFDRSSGERFAESVFPDTVKDIFALKEQPEIDPVKVKGDAGATIDKSVKVLERLYDEMLDALCDEIRNLPQEICDLTRFVSDKTMLSGGSLEGARHAITGTVVLRFLNPELVSPSRYTNSGKFDAECHRTGLLLSKILQGQANGRLEFKEPFMECCVGMVIKNSERFERMLDEIYSQGRPVV